MAEVTSLCGSCRGQLQAAGQTGEPTTVAISFHDLHRGSRGGCAVCSWTTSLWVQRVPEGLAWLQGAPDPSDPSDGHESESNGPALQRSVRVDAVGFPFDDPESGSMNKQAGIFLLHPAGGGFAFKVILELHSQDQQWPMRYQPCSNTAGASTFDLIKRWSQQCLSRHAACCAPDRAGWRPSRLIKITGDSVQGLLASLREAEFNDYDSTVEYAALSHRWLPTEPIRLEITNRSQLRDSIPAGTLKQAIRDAMEVTLRLGMSHLWVDTLCIVQDDAEDKAREISNMHRIYEQSKHVIAASTGDADDVDAACFTTRDTTMIQIHEVSLNLSGFVSTYRMRLDWGEGYGDLGVCILGKRAWIFQERFLSPRIIHYCKGQVHWQCREFEASETYPEGRPGWDLEYGPRDTVQPFKDLGEADTMTKLQVPSWHQIVYAYTSLEMTFSNDRLNALLGIANYCITHYEDEYVLGLFRRTLIIGLLWKVSMRLGEYKQMRLPDIAPSWSWASISDPVDFLRVTPNPDDTILVTLIDIIHRSENGQPGHSTMLHLSACPIEGVVSGEQGLLGAMGAIFRADADRFSVTVDLDTDEGRLDNLSVAFMPILFGPYEDAIGRLAGLVLKLRGLIQDVPAYQRIGIFQTNTWFEMNESSEMAIFIC